MRERGGECDGRARECASNVGNDWATEVGTKLGTECGREEVIEGEATDMPPNIEGAADTCGGIPPPLARITAAAAAALAVGKPPKVGTRGVWNTPEKNKYI